MESNALYRVQMLLGLLFLAAGAAKLAGAAIMISQFELIGLGQNFRLVFGLLEILGGLCLFVPRTAVYGAVLLSWLMLGAVGATIAHVGRVALTPPPPSAPQITVPTVFPVVLEL
jgi:putative oxidoreductase